MPIYTKEKKKKQFYRRITLLFLLLFLFFTTSLLTEKFYAPENVVKRAKNKIELTVNQAIITANKVSGFVKQKKEINWTILEKQFKKSKDIIVITQKGKIVFWNNNIFPEHLLQMTKINTPVFHFEKNKLYLLYQKKQNKFTISVFISLNQKNLPPGSRIIKGLHFNKNNIPLKNWNITITTDKTQKPKAIPLWFFILYLIIIYTGLESVFVFYQIQKPQRISKRTKQFLFILVLIFLRLIVAWAGFPEIFRLEFASNPLTKIPGFHTAADILINAIWFIVFLQFLRNTENEDQKKWQKNKWLKILGIEIIVLSIPILFYSVTESLIQNRSGILFHENIYFTQTGFVNIFILIVVNVLIYLWIDFFVSIYKKNKLKDSYVLALLLVIAAIFFLIFPFNKQEIIAAWFITTSLTITIYKIDRKEKPYIHSLLTIFILSLVIAFVLNQNEKANKNARQIYTANLLTQKRDPFLEYMVKNKAAKILNDQTIRKVIYGKSGNKESAIKKILSQKYFGKTLKAYTTQVTLCEPGQQLEIQPENRLIECERFFKRLKGPVIDSTTHFELSFIPNTGESIYYLAQFKYNEKNTPFNLYVEFFTNIIPKGIGYPELLQNKKEDKINLSGYSFAFYRQGKLEYKFGDFLYPIDMAKYKTEPERTFINLDGFTHYKIPVGKNEILIVSRPQTKLSDRLLPFSLSFILLAIILVTYIVITYGKQIRKTYRYSFSTRLQITMFSAMMVVYAILTMVIISYFNTNSKRNISNILKEKINSVAIELKQNFYPYPNQPAGLQIYLQKLSMIFFTDIHLYNPSGFLITSSRPEIFSAGLQSKLMNPEAFFKIEKEHKLFYLGKEKIRNATFYSAYAPLILENGKEAGIINLPYFARQSELQYTYFRMLTNLINLFVFSGLIGMLIMIYLSKLLTKPLEVLQQKIKNVSIEKQNEKIEWPRQDEIGKLIEAYNSMVDKLEESARLLKDSEREKAWREMAQQIAHEIRNPLTPMKLNIQYLKKLYQANDPSFKEKTETISQSLIDQIETLNEVVDMFYDFSKTQKPKEEKADLIQTIQSTISLFRKSYPVKIEFNTETEKINVAISQRDLVRILNNLFKNAIQSMEKSTEKKIEVYVTKQTETAIVQIKDTGKGMDEEERKHIFIPYFTTKSKGNGLGLAIVKNLILKAGGSIRVTSEKGKGTSFTLHFPLK